MNNLYLIISREYLERVKRKSFIISTLLMPLLMLALMLAPTLIMVLSGPDSKTIGVIDRSGLVAADLRDIDDLHFSQLPAVMPLGKDNRSLRRHPRDWRGRGGLPFPHKPLYKRRALDADRDRDYIAARRSP